MLAAGDAAGGLALLERAAAANDAETALLAVFFSRVRAACLMALGRNEEAAQGLEEALAGATRQSLLYEQLLISRARVELACRSGTAPSPEDLREAERLAQLLGLDDGLR